LTSERRRQRSRQQACSGDSSQTVLQRDCSFVVTLLTMLPTKLADKIGKQGNLPDQKIIWPIAPDGYIPNSVVRSLAPFPKFSRYYCAEREIYVKAQVEEDRTRILEKFKNFTLGETKQSVPEETTGSTSFEPFQSKRSWETKTGVKVTPPRRAAAQRQQHMLQDRQNFLQENGSSKETLQANASSVEELQTNVSSVDELKNEEDVDFTHPPETVPQSLSPESNAFPTKQAKKVKKGRKARFNLPEGSSPSPMLQRVNKDEVQRVKDGLKQEIASSIKEPKKSLQDSMEKRHVAEIGDLIQNVRQKTNNFTLKKLKSFVTPHLPMGDRRPPSLLMYIYRKSKAESSPSDGVKSGPKEAWTSRN